MRDLFSEIWESISRNKLRTCLTGFSVSWGIFMLIVLLGAGNGLLNSFRKGGADFASNTMMIGGGWTSKPYAGFKQGRHIRLDTHDADLLRRGSLANHIDKVSYNISKSGFTMAFRKKYFKDISLCGAYPEDVDMNKIKICAGRFINGKDIEMKRKVIVLQHVMARNLLAGKENYDELLGQRVKIGDFSFQIIGIRKAEENTDDRNMHIPYSTLKTVFGYDNKVDQITFSFHGLDSEKENEEFEKHLRSVINTAHSAAPDDSRAIWIWNRFTQNLQMEKGNRIILTALWIIGIFTLLSGIVGVSNIMLITVKERTHEFGIRKAIGASPWSITKLIITESVTITAFFGYIGMALGMIACQIMDKTLGHTNMELFGSDISMLVNPTVGIDVAVEATVLLVVAGTIAGLLPARNAAKVRPIEALRATK